MPRSSGAPGRGEVPASKDLVSLSQILSDGPSHSVPTCTELATRSLELVVPMIVEPHLVPNSLDSFEVPPDSRGFTFIGYV